MHWNGDWHMGWMGLGWIVVVALIVAVIWCVLSSTRDRRNGGSKESPREILDRRYAKGEIDRETYERMLEDLRA